MLLEHMWSDSTSPRPSTFPPHGLLEPAVLAQPQRSSPEQMDLVFFMKFINFIIVVTITMRSYPI